MPADLHPHLSPLPANKFYPPHISQSQSLFRTALLDQKLPAKEAGTKVLIIEAQAGQGKTTLVSQYLDYHNHTFIWYQIGPEDSDPVYLLSSLLTNLCSNLAGFSSPQLANILLAGSVGPLDLTRCANLLLHDLDGYLTKPVYLVLDDLHLLEYQALTNRLLEHLIDTSPPHLRFVLVSRQPLEIKGRTIRDGNRIAYLSTADLALNEGEVETLYNTVLKKTISRQEAMKIQRVTNGWIMGIILASHPISGRNSSRHDADDRVMTMAAGSGHMLDYFQDEIFAQLPREHHIPFLKLSFLQEIPADLAAVVAGSADFGQVLADLARENYFIYHLDDRQQLFRFHHFFQEFLQQRGRARFSPAEIAAIHAREAEYYLAREMVEKALTCYRYAGDLATMESLLRTRGMELITKNRTISILTLLQSIPEETLFQHSWLTLYAGLLRVDFAPQTTLPFFDNARAQFTASGEETGELIALSQTIYFHFVISGDYTTGATLLPRTRTLLEKNFDSLPMPILIMAARNLASGYCFFKGEMEKARHFIRRASSLASKHDIRNFIASTRFIQGYIELLSGNRAKYLREAELCYSLFHDPLVGESNRLTMRVMNLCYLSMVGDHFNFKQQQQALQNSINHNVVEQTVAAPYLYIWGSSSLYSLGQPDKALELLDRGQGVTATAATPHMHSQILQWQAFGLALTGRTEEAARAIGESTSLRRQAGGPFYTAFNHIIAGAVYCRLQQPAEADRHLRRGLAISAEIGSTYLNLCGLFNQVYHTFLFDGPDAALEGLERALALMKISGYNHFWSWEPVMMGALLSLAVARDIEPVFAQSLARLRLQSSFRPDGSALPLLQCTLMDSFALKMGGKVLFRANDLTPFQRELLGLLLTARGQRLAQEKIQVELWPESPPDNARKSFDTLVTRLRKLLAPKLPVSVREYLPTQKGILCLNNVIIDSLEFVEAARTGLTHSRNSDWWQAHNCFQRALAMWQGAKPEDVLHGEQALAWNDMLASLLVEMVATWADSLVESNRLEEAISLLEQALRHNYLEEELTIRLYRLHLLNNSPLKAREALERYRKALLQAEYEEEEAASYIEAILGLGPGGGMGR